MKRKITNAKFQILRSHRHFGVVYRTNEHHKDVEWLKDVQKELEQDEGQDKIDITKG